MDNFVAWWDRTRCKQNYIFILGRKVVEKCKIPGILLDFRWNTEVIYKKEQRRLHFLKKLKSFFKSVMESTYLSVGAATLEFLKVAVQKKYFAFAVKLNEQHYTFFSLHRLQNVWSHFGLLYPSQFMLTVMAARDMQQENGGAGGKILLANLLFCICKSLP